MRNQIKNSIKKDTALIAKNEINEISKLLKKVPGLKKFNMITHLRAAFHWIGVLIIPHLLFVEKFFKMQGMVLSHKGLVFLILKHQLNLDKLLYKALPITT